MIAVFNSSPLIFLSKLNILDHALELFSQVYIPGSVEKEIYRKKDDASKKVKAMLNMNNVSAIKPNNSRMVEAFRKKLGRGESDAIVIASEQSADLVILDDHVAREEAKRIGLDVKGTLGIIRRLMELDIIHYDSDKLYQNLLEIKFRVKRNIFDEIVAIEL